MAALPAHMTKRLQPFLFAVATAIIVPLACGGRSDLDDGADQTGGNGSGGFSSSGGSTSGGGSGGYHTGAGGYFDGPLATGGLWASGGETSSGGATAGFGGLGGASGDFFPEDLLVTTPLNGSWKLVLTAFTLEDGDSGLELYGAIRNDGDQVTCAVELAVELFGASGESLVAASNTLKHPGHYLYSLDADTQAIVSCLAPGETAMGVVTEFPPGLKVADVVHLNYRCPSLILNDLEPVDGLAVTDLTAIPTDQGSAYAGVFENGLDVALSNATVFVFPTTESGRPLGMTTSQATSDVPAHGDWTFQTSSVADPGADETAFFDFDNPL